MNMLNPIWLWGLSGLAIPIAIHLLSRKEGKTIRIGSIRFLVETSTSRFSSIRLNEILLLLIRGLLIILIVFFLAEFLFSLSNKEKSNHWVLVEKGLDEDFRIKTLLDSLKQNKYEIRRFSEGFPTLGNDTIYKTDYYKLTEELSAIRDIQAIVIARNNLSYFRGKRISLPDNIKWLSYPEGIKQSLIDSLQVSDTVRITIAYDKDFLYDKKIITAAFNALQAYVPKLTITETNAALFNNSIQTDWLVWLTNSKLTYPGKSLRYKNSSLDKLITEESNNHWLLTKRLDELNAVADHLTVQLMSMVFKNKINHQINISDSRSLSDNLAWSTRDEPQSFHIKQAGQSVNRILILAIALLFILERILAFYRKQ